MFRHIVTALAGAVIFACLGTAPDAALAGQAAPDCDSAIALCAARGDKNAQFQLGLAYAQGLGVRRDLDQAAWQFWLASLQGHGNAQYAYGLLYEFGGGVPQNSVRAYLWFSLAAENLRGAEADEASVARDRVAATLTPAELLEAQRAARECTESNYQSCTPLGATTQVAETETSPVEGGDPAAGGTSLTLEQQRALAPSQQPTPSVLAFTRRSLSSGVEIDVPDNWNIWDNATYGAVTSAASAELEEFLSEFGPENDNEATLLAATSFPFSTYAALRVSRITPPLLTPSEMSLLSRPALAEIEDVMSGLMERALATVGQRLLSAPVARIASIEGFPALSISYRRSGIHGPVLVQLIQIARSMDTIEVNLSYRESEAGQWARVVEHVKQSIRLRLEGDAAVDGNFAAGNTPLPQTTQTPAAIVGDGVFSDSLLDALLVLLLSSGMLLLLAVGWRRLSKLFPAIDGNLEAALYCARLGALGGLGLAALYLLTGLVLAFQPELFPGGDPGPDVAGEKLLGVAVSLPVALFLTYRVYTGKGYLSAVLLFGLILTEFAGKLAAGRGPLSLLIYGTISLGLINGVRGCWAMHRLGSGGTDGGIDFSRWSSGPSRTIVRKAPLVFAGAAILGTVIFPPYHARHASGVWINMGYAPIFDPPVGGVTVSIDTGMLILEWFGILLLAGIGWLLAGTINERRNLGAFTD